MQMYLFYIILHLVCYNLMLVDWYFKQLIRYLLKTSYKNAVVGLVHACFSTFILFKKKRSQTIYLYLNLLRLYILGRKQEQEWRKNDKNKHRKHLKTLKILKIIQNEWIYCLKNTYIFHVNLFANSTIVTFHNTHICIDGRLHKRWRLVKAIHFSNKIFNIK